MASSRARPRHPHVRRAREGLEQLPDCPNCDAPGNEVQLTSFSHNLHLRHAREGTEQFLRVIFATPPISVDSGYSHSEHSHLRCAP
jgi:hypothetical protein